MEPRTPYFPTNMHTLRPRPRPTPEAAPVVHCSPIAAALTGQRVTHTRPPGVARQQERLGVRGAVVPSPRSIVPGFSRFGYQDAHVGQSPRRSPRQKQQPPPPFKHGVTLAPQQAGSFQVFRHADGDRYAAPEELKRREKQEASSWLRTGAFVAGGNARASQHISSRRSAELCAKLVWLFREATSAFLRVTEDPKGYLLVVFAGRGEEETRAQIHAFMNHFVTHRASDDDFCLARDPCRWGALAGKGDDEIVVFSLRLPWVRNDPYRISRAVAPRPGAVGA